MTISSLTAAGTAGFTGLHAMILAGGVGSRLDGYSTPEKPKPFLPITSPMFTMIQMTYRRLMAPAAPCNTLFDPSRIHVMTNERYARFVEEQLPAVPSANVYCEPAGMNRDTGPAVAVGMRHIAEKDGDAIVAVMPSDQHIGDALAFAGRLEEAAGIAAATGTIVLVGVEPTWPSPHFGYIRMGGRVDSHVDARWAREFVEKPSTEAARGFLETGDYMWNSAIMVAGAQVFLRMVAQYRPVMAGLIDRLFSGAIDQRRFYELVEHVCVNNSVFVPAAKDGRVSVVRLGADWYDVGTWEGIAALVDMGTITPPPEVFLRLGMQSGLRAGGEE